LELQCCAHSREYNSTLAKQLTTHFLRSTDPLPRPLSGMSTVQTHFAAKVEVVRI
jgi:hypothetical protein